MRKIIIFLLLLIFPIFGQHKISKPKNVTYYMAYNTAKRIYHIGFTEPNQLTTSGMPYMISDTLEIEYLKKVEEINPDVKSEFTNLQLLPKIGEFIESNTIYLAGDKIVIARKEHIRTVNETINDSNLYIKYDLTANKYPDWTAGEEIGIGTIRVYDGVNYQAIKKHKTEEGKTPDLLKDFWKTIEVKEARMEP